MRRSYLHYLTIKSIETWFLFAFWMKSTTWRKIVSESRYSPYEPDSGWAWRKIVSESRHILYEPDSGWKRVTNPDLPTPY